MKKLVVFAAAFIAFTGYSFSGNKSYPAKKSQSTSTNTQADDMIRYFRIHRQAKDNVVLNWGVNTPAGISAFTLERSYDGEFFDVMDQVNCTNDIRYSWKDESIFPGYIYYRVGCMMNDGSMHYSEVEVIRIVQRHG